MLHDFAGSSDPNQQYPRPGSGTAYRNADSSLTFDGYIAICKVSISQYGSSISATMQLWYNGELIRSWNGSGTSYVSLYGEEGVLPGRPYTLTVSGTIDGVAFTTQSCTNYCP